MKTYEMFMAEDVDDHSHEKKRIIDEYHRASKENPHMTHDDLVDHVSKKTGVKGHYAKTLISSHLIK